MVKTRTPLPKFGRMLNPIKDMFLEIRKSKRLGADFVEIGFERPAALEFITKNKEKIKEELKKNGLFAAIHMAYWSDLGSEYASVRDAWIDECKKAIHAASLIGAKKFLVHAGVTAGLLMLVPDARKNILDGFEDSLNQLGSYAKKHDMILVAENEYISKLNMRIADFKSLSKRLTHPYMALDTGHAFIGNSNRTIIDFIRFARKNIKHMHMHDNHGKSDEHLPIGKGKIKYSMIVKELKKLKYDETITLEIFKGGDFGYRSSLNKIKRMWNS